jgi:TRAP-type C4-dicarboxylate transport system permease small subunit
VLKTIRARVDRILEGALVVLMAANVLNVLWQVFTRFVLRNPSSYTEELARFLLIWVGLLGAGYASGRKLHLAVAVLLQGTGGRLRHGLEVFIQACVFCFALLVMVAGGLRLVSITLRLDQVSAALRIPLGYVYLAIPLSGLLIMFYALEEALKNVRNLRGG